MSAAPRFARIAIPSPLPRHFDYRLIAGDPVPAPGTRVRVPFGRQETVGVVLGVSAESTLPPEKLKTIRQLLDAERTIGRPHDRQQAGAGDAGEDALSPDGRVHGLHFARE